MVVANDDPHDNVAPAGYIQGLRSVRVNATSVHIASLLQPDFAEDLPNDVISGGELYSPIDSEIQADLATTKRWLLQFNASSGEPVVKRFSVLAERLESISQRTVIRPPFFCDYGYNIRLGEDVFIRFNCVILDVVSVTIGSRSQVAPAVQIYAVDQSPRFGHTPSRPGIRQAGGDRQRRMS